MAIIIQKFGGTSVATIERIKKVALIIKAEIENGNSIVVVVSAMSGVTDQLINLTKELTRDREEDALEEYDNIISTGEQVTASLLSLALKQISVESIFYLGWQLPIITDNKYSKASIIEINKEKILANLADNKVVVVAGFQGVTTDGRITTLGRGGSDTSAVAIAASLEAERCDIYTDVSGVYTADPHIVSDARKLNNISYSHMLEMSSLGAKILATNSVIIAMKNNLHLSILSSFEKTSGTNISIEEQHMDNKIITGISSKISEIFITIEGISNCFDACKIFSLLFKQGISLDMINQTQIGQGTTIHFTISENDLNKTVTLINELKSVIDYKAFAYRSNLAKISMIGIGIKTNTEINEIIFNILQNMKIEILALACSEIKLSILIEEDYKDDVIKILHKTFDLAEII